MKNAEFTDPQDFTVHRSIEPFLRINVWKSASRTYRLSQVGRIHFPGKHLFEGGFSPEDGLNDLLALLCHDVGFVKGALKKDDPAKSLFDDGEGGMIEIPDTGTCALLQPYHVSRAKVFVHERIDNFEFIDIGLVSDCIERTRFPVPTETDCERTDDLPGLARAADLIG